MSNYVTAKLILHAVYNAINAASPREMVSSFVKNNPQFLDEKEKIKIFALGKASLPMVDGFLDVVPDDRLLSGLVITHIDSEHQKTSKKIQIVKAPHPLPDESSIRAGTLAREFFQESNSTDHMVCLISGGGSSMMVAPKRGLKPSPRFFWVMLLFSI